MRLLGRSRRKRERLRPLGEAECYHRLHGDRDADVRVVKLVPRRPRFPLRVTGEDLRRRFEERLDRRAPDRS
jgi:hypothetical protein